MITRRRKSQALILVTFLLFVVSTIISGIAPTVMRDVMVRSTQEYGDIAFTLAQTALEKAKVEILYDGYWFGGSWDRPGGTENWYYAPWGKVQANCNNNNLGYWFCDLAFPDGLLFRYQYRILNPGAGSTQRHLTARGQVLDSYNNVLGQRTIQVSIDGISDGDSNSVDDDLTGSLVANSWREE